MCSKLNKYYIINDWSHTPEKQCRVRERETGEEMSVSHEELSYEITEFITIWSKYSLAKPHQWHVAVLGLVSMFAVDIPAVQSLDFWKELRIHNFSL